jgi:uncharacterized membrane protein YedE/YeeE
MIVVGGFMVGFGTRYAGGCTSGHAIMGLSTLQWPFTCCYLLFYDWWFAHGQLHFTTYSFTLKTILVCYLKLMLK